MRVTIPPGVVHKNVGDQPGWVFNGPNRLYRARKKHPVDEIRHELDPESPYKVDSSSNAQFSWQSTGCVMPNKIKGIVLAGGSGTRLHPMTLAISKQLLPIYDKPMVYYPFSINAYGHQDILIVSPATSRTSKNFLSVSRFGVSFSYAEQPKRKDNDVYSGDSFIAEIVRLVLETLFYGHGFRGVLDNATSRESFNRVRLSGATPSDSVLSILMNLEEPFLSRKTAKAKSIYASLGSIL